MTRSPRSPSRAPRGRSIRCHTLSVTADAGVGDARFAALRATAARYGDLVNVRRVAGTLHEALPTGPLPGGAAIYGGGYRCSLGFTVHRGTTPYFLTAGHCGQAVSTWYAGAHRSAVLGHTVAYTYPGRDYALVEYAGPAYLWPSTAGGGRAVTGAADPYVGEHVTSRGSTSGVHSGTVTGLDATVDYGNGEVVSGLIETDVCSEPGDSGGPLYSGTTALGLTSGGDGDCAYGGATYFQPVTAALRAYGVRIG
ncbi:S1 family peptidase [Streptomyces sp. RB6PN25]|uniref:S1 family peptidase n=1 Tax=Streptomyces humicola TaxID=2953240 RepID=A0ABT1Q1T0_9ACTN|nr:S1 family peptidase [Streptomyces humicola]MCQ4083260.1 S1 family peptidase [Streptomyces humicola]